MQLSLFQHIYPRLWRKHYRTHNVENWETTRDRPSWGKEKGLFFKQSLVEDSSGKKGVYKHSQRVHILEEYRNNDRQYAFVGTLNFKYSIYRDKHAETKYAYTSRAFMYGCSVVSPFISTELTLLSLFSTLY